MKSLQESIGRLNREMNKKLTDEKERISRIVLSKVGYPNNIEWYVYQGNKYSLVDIVSGVEYASVSVEYDDVNCFANVVTNINKSVLTGIG